MLNTQQHCVILHCCSSLLLEANWSPCAHVRLPSLYLQSGDSHEVFALDTAALNYTAGGQTVCAYAGHVRVEVADMAYGPQRTSMVITSRNSDPAML